MTRDEVYEIRKVLEQSMQSMDKNTASKFPNLFPLWENLKGKTITVEDPEKHPFRFQHNGQLYELSKQYKTHTFQANWIPGEGTQAIYQAIPKPNAGTKEDPIPFVGMRLEKGKYYLDNEIMFLCTEDSVIAVFGKLSAMPRYVKRVK